MRLKRKKVMVGSLLFGVPFYIGIAAVVFQQNGWKMALMSVILSAICFVSFATGLSILVSEDG